MYETIKSLHSYFAWAALIVLAVVFLLAVLATFGGREQSVKKPALFALMAIHIQFLLGLVLYFVSPFGFSNISGDTMKDAMSRLLAVEHPLTNIIAVILITIGYSRAKRKLSESESGKTIMWFYGIGLVLLLSRIPWASWLG